MAQSRDNTEALALLKTETTTTPPPRKRVGKACDRCRNKKSKCNGQQSCSRCTDDNELCLYSQRDKGGDKLWPRGTVETMQKQRDILGDTILTLYKKAFPDVPDSRVPAVHQIAEDMHCMGTLEVSGRAICKVHETIADGLLRLRKRPDCPECAKNKKVEDAENQAREQITMGHLENQLLEQTLGPGPA
ncbi:MAG: hypothetical protein HETSPECPRED_005308 [Heterodermia speciosa]|uniref:Zn(2)-C6 fungal-type domain-containing protein n=1 Tax=Heterodermia speciosa TaxID=116794 RepID=A0A8H3FF23_9LECA|nr:MAG: hypothetical protein HETSPECPRED_005308 [Heterodermia speciosa]